MSIGLVPPSGMSSVCLCLLPRAFLGLVQLCKTFLWILSISPPDYTGWDGGNGVTPRLPRVGVVLLSAMLTPSHVSSSIITGTAIMSLRHCHPKRTTRRG